MGSIVHDHPEGYVMVRDENSVFYADTRENLERDFGVTFPPLPTESPFGPAIERIYEPGKRHAINAQGNTIDGGDMPWTLGDALISHVQAGLAARQRREGPPPKQAPLPEPTPQQKALEQRYRFPRMPGT